MNRLLQEGNNNVLRQTTEFRQLPVDYKQLDHRVKSFKDNPEWSSEEAPVSPTKLSEAGLYYTGPRDRVQCAWCGGGLYNWEQGDNAIVEHQKHFPKCPYVAEWIEKTVSGRGVHFGFDNSSFETGFDRLRDPIVDILRRLGYDDVILEAALNSLFGSAGDGKFTAKLTTSLLLDAVYECESKVQTTPNKLESKFSGGACNVLHSIETESTNNEESEEDFKSMVEKHSLKSNLSNSLNTDLEVRSENKVDTSNVAVKSKNTSNKYLENDHEPATSKESPQKEVKPLEMPVEPEVKKLWSENQKLKENKTCRICLDEDVSVLFLPCRHLATCEECAECVEKCPICRSQVVATVKTYLS